MTLTQFAKATGQRMVRAAATAMLSVVVVGGGVLNAFDVDWHNVLGVGAGAALVSLLLCLAGGATSGNGPAFGKVEQTTPALEADPPAGEHGRITPALAIDASLLAALGVALLLFYTNLGR